MILRILNALFAAPGRVLSVEPGLQFVLQRYGAFRQRPTAAFYQVTYLSFGIHLLM